MKQLKNADQMSLNQINESKRRQTYTQKQKLKTERRGKVWVAEKRIELLQRGWGASTFEN